MLVKLKTKQYRDYLKRYQVDITYINGNAFYPSKGV